MRCTFKVSIVGVGNVGATLAYSLLLAEKVTDLVLVGHTLEKVDAEKSDLEHCLPFLQHVEITATTSYEAIAGSDVTVVTAGAAQEPGQSRLDLLKNNLKLFSDIVPKIYEANPHGLVLVVTNPVDILTYHCYQVAPFKPGQCFGTGTLLDTARFRQNLANIFHVQPRSIHAYVLGEHGDSSFPFLSSANIGGKDLATFSEYSEERVLDAYNRAKNAAYQIIKNKGATYYAIATLISQILEAIYSDSSSVLPVSIPLRGYYGEEDVSLSIPCVVNQKGVTQRIDLKLSREEEQRLHHSALVLKDAYLQAIKD